MPTLEAERKNITCPTCNHIELKVIKIRNHPQDLICPICDTMYREEIITKYLEGIIEINKKYEVK